MADSMGVQISGLDEAIAKLKEQAAIIVIKGMTNALDLAGGVIAAEISSQAPSGEYEELQDSVEIEITLDSQLRGGVASIGYFGGTSERTGKPLVSIADWVEYGHIMADHKGKQITTEGKTTFVGANPFMRRAFAASKDRAVDVFAESIARTILEQADTHGQ